MGTVLQIGGTGRIEIHKLDKDKDFETSIYSLWSYEKQQRLELTLSEAIQIIQVLQQDLFDFNLSNVRVE